MISRKYNSVTAEIEGLEGEPEGELLQSLLTKKLFQAGAADDLEPAALVSKVPSDVNDQAPNLPESVGAVLRRTHAGGHIELDNITLLSWRVCCKRVLTTRSPSERPFNRAGARARLRNW